MLVKLGFIAISKINFSHVNPPKYAQILLTLREIAVGS